MSADESVDIVIVGGGLMGLTLAATLRHCSYSIVLIEKGDAPSHIEPQAKKRRGAVLDSGFEPRVSALNQASRSLLDRVEGWPDDARICAFMHMLVRDSRGTGSISFDAQDIDEPSLGYIVENRNLLATLFASIATQDNLEARFGTDIEIITKRDAGYRVILSDGLEIDCGLLIGADGGNSIVREAVGIRTLGWTYGQTAIVSTVETEKPHEKAARQWFTEEGPLAFLPIECKDEKLRSIVCTTNRPEELMKMDEESFCALLTDRSESELGAVLGIDRRYSFPLRQQHSVRYVRPHLTLVGDAAHTIHPLAGQGANLGLADVHTLSIILSESAAAGREPGDIAGLRRYQLVRQPQNLAMASAMEVFRRIYEPGHPAISWLRNTGTRLVDGNRMLKSVLMRVAAGR
jgi:2-octaprenylphenol hydroxylase